MSKFDYDKYTDRIKKLFNNERGSLLAQQVTKLKTPTSALSANILMGTSQLGDNGQVGFTSLSPTQNISFPIDHYLHCNVGLEWYFVVGNFGKGTFLIIFLYHQLLPVKYCTTEKGSNLYDMGSGRVLETIVSFVYDGKREYVTNVQMLEENVVQNPIGPFWLPGSNEELVFGALDNSLKTFTIISKDSFYLTFKMGQQGPLLNTYGTGTCKNRAYMAYTWAPLSFTGSYKQNQISGTGTMDHQWGTLANKNLLTQILRTVGLINVCPINLGWGLSSKEIVVACNFNSPSFIRCFEPCSIYMAGASLFFWNTKFPRDIILTGVVPTGEKIMAIYTLIVKKWVKLGETMYPLYLEATLKPNTLGPVNMTQPMAPPGGLPSVFQISPIYEDQRVFWASGGEAWEGGTILTANNKTVGTGFLECVGWLKWTDFTSQVLEKVDLEPTKKNINLFLTRSQITGVSVFTLIVFAVVVLLVLIGLSAIKLWKKKLFYPWKSLILGGIVVPIIIVIIIVLVYNKIN